MNSDSGFRIQDSGAWLWIQLRWFWNFSAKPNSLSPSRLREGLGEGCFRSRISGKKDSSLQPVIPENFLFAAKQRKKIDPESDLSGFPLDPASDQSFVSQGKYQFSFLLSALLVTFGRFREFFIGEQTMPNSRNRLALVAVAAMATLEIFGGQPANAKDFKVGDCVIVYPDRYPTAMMSGPQFEGGTVVSVDKGQHFYGPSGYTGPLYGVDLDEPQRSSLSWGSGSLYPPSHPSSTETLPGYRLGSCSP